MTDEIAAISPDTVFISGQALTESDTMDAVDDVLENLRSTGDISTIDTTIDNLLGLQKISGKAMAKLLYGSKNWWVQTKHQGSFDDHMESRHGLKKVTIDRYITVWGCVTTKQIPSSVAIRPMRELVPIAKTLSHGHDITKDQWKKIAKANGLGEIGAILRDVKGKPARKSSQQIYFERDGSLVAWKNNKRKFIGWLDLELYNSDEDAKKAIDRLLDSAGVIRK